MDSRENVTIYIDKEVVQKAKESGFKISKICENALKDGIRRMERPNAETNGGSGFLGEVSFSKEGSLAGPSGVEPETYGLRAST